MYQVEVPDCAVRWNIMLYNDANGIYDEETGEHILIELLIHGAISFKNNSCRKIKDGHPVILWISKPQESGAWSVLISNYEDDDEETLFQPLIRELHLQLYHTLKICDIPNLFDIPDKKLVLTIEHDHIYVTNDIHLTDALKQKIQPSVLFEDINLSFSRPYDPLFPVDDGIEKLFEISPVCNIFYTNTVWEGMISNFIDTVNSLKGSPSLTQLKAALNQAGVKTVSQQIEPHGVTSVDIMDPLMLPKISLNSRLPDNIARPVLCHETGHLIMHLPILTAEALQSIYPSLKNQYADIKACIHSIYPVLDNEADWVGALLLCPPHIIAFLKSFYTDRDFRFFYQTREGLRETPLEFRIFFNLRRAVLGQGVPAFETLYDSWDLFSRFILKEDRLETSENEVFINRLLVRYTNQIVNFQSFSPYYEGRAAESQRIISDSFHVIMEYLGRYEGD